MNQELPDIQAGFRKTEKPEIKWPTFTSHRKCEGIPEKISTSASLTMLKPLTVCITTNWKILKEMGILDHVTCLLRNCMQLTKQQLEIDKEQWSGSKLGKEYTRPVYCHPAYLTNMQSTSCKMPG